MGFKLLFGYPIEANTDNWLHDCIIAALESIHAQTPVTSWIEHFPSAFQTKLSSRQGLKSRLEAYQTALETLTVVQKNQVLKALKDQNEIPKLLAGQHDCERISALPPTIQTVITKLFDFGFTLLTDLKIRDKHYSIIYQKTHHLCPFCGYEYFSSPRLPRENLDHYLAKSIYPFAGINLNNLVPMGMKCNLTFKKTQDILLQNDGTSRKALNPYNTQGIKIVLTDSRLFEGQNLSPSWDIKFDPDCEEAETWDQVFSVRKRFEEDFLNEENFKNLLRQFSKWAEYRPNPLENLTSLKQAFIHYLAYIGDMGFNNQAEIYIKRAVFEMLEVQCDDVLLQHLRDYPPVVSP